MSLGEIANWSRTCPLEAILLLAGIGMGVFYGFDGWRGSTKDVLFKDSPRSKNFIYAAGGAFTVFISDIKVVDKSADKSRLLLFYLAGFSAAVTLVVLFWGLGIYFNARLSRRKSSAGDVPTPFEQMAHYFHYGYKSLQDWLQQRLQDAVVQRLDRFKSFVKDYNAQMSYSIAAVSAYLAGRDAPTRQLIGKQVLVSIRTVVLAYHGESDGLEVNCSYMAVRDRHGASPDLPQRLLVAPGDEKQYAHYLVFEGSTRDANPENFVLPVPAQNDPAYASVLLPGAPTAFFNNNRVVVNDTAKIETECAPGLGKHAVLKMKEYFKQANFHSFACLNIAYGGKQLGILNIDSNKKFILGEDDANQNEITNFLLPFCGLLGYILED